MKTEVKTDIEKCKVFKFPSDEQLNETAVQEMDEISELISLVDSLPVEYRSGFYSTIQRLVDNAEQRQQILSVLHESLTQMNLDLKYLIFDLEATRRERDECLKLVNNW
jgi:hypothetical protein